MKNKKIKLRYNNKTFSIVVGECNFLEQVLGLMVFRKKALLLFNFKKPRIPKIHSFFCNPFLAVYTDDKNKVLEIIHVKNWRPLILPRSKFNKLIEIPLVKRYSSITKKLIFRREK